jgi:hypothetical protein
VCSVWPTYKLLTYDLKTDTLPTCVPYRLFSLPTSHHPFKKKKKLITKQNRNTQTCLAKKKERNTQTSPLSFFHAIFSSVDGSSSIGAEILCFCCLRIISLIILYNYLYLYYFINKSFIFHLQKKKIEIFSPLSV